MKAAPQIIIMGAKAPPWVLSGAAVDMDFANGRYYGDTLANLLSISRASQVTDLLQTSASLATGTYTLWCNGSGSVTPSGGTATITGAAAASQGAPNTFTVTVA